MVINPMISKNFVLMMIEESDNWSTFYDQNQKLIESSGHILDTTEVTYYAN